MGRTGEGAKRPVTRRSCLLAGGVTKHCIGCIGLVTHDSMAQYKVVKGKRSGSVLVI